MIRDNLIYELIIPIKIKSFTSNFALKYLILFSK